MKRFSLLALALWCAPPCLAASPEELRSAVEAKFAITSRDRLGHVTRPGTVMVLQQSGLRADKPKLVLRPAEVRNGVLTNVGGGTFLGGDSGKTLDKGARLHLYDVKVRDQDIILIVATTDTFQIVERGDTRSIPYQTAVAFAYDEGSAGVSPERLLADIDEWFKTEAESATTNMKTISLGQTYEEVVAILGQPEKKIDLGSKVTFVYTDMKILFIDGKVSDVQ